MKTTEKGKLSIEMGKDNISTILFCPVDNTVWMDKNDLCELFGVYMPTIDPCLESIFNSKIFDVPKVCRYQLLSKRNKLLEGFREPKYIDFPKLILEQNYLLN